MWQKIKEKAKKVLVENCIYRNFCSSFCKGSSEKRKGKRSCSY